MGTDKSNAVITMLGKNGSLNLGIIEDQINVVLTNPNGEPRARLYMDSDGNGFITTFNSEGEIKCYL